MEIRTRPAEVSRHASRSASVALVLIVTQVLGCAPSQPDGSSPARTELQQAPPKRLVAAIRSSPTAVTTDLDLSAVSGADALNKLVQSGLTALEDNGVRVPQLAEAVPSTSNGLWRVLPDGRMEMTWKIRPGAKWHDLQPVRSADYALSAKVRGDKEVAVSRSPAFALVDSVETPDDATVLVKWKQPYIDADTLFSENPLPAHLLQATYLENKAGLTQAPYWTSTFIGTGPYQVREFASGSQITLEAFDQYVHGRPKIREIEVRFIPDGTTLIANILSGVVQLTFGARNLSYEEAAEARDQWREGKVVANSRSTVFLYPQFLNPTPPILANVQFRRALVHAINREELANTFQGGLSAVPHGYVSPEVAEYAETQLAIAKYEYDPRRTVQMIEGLGYARDTEGFFRDAGGQRPSVEVRTTTASENQKLMFAIVDYFQRAGVAAEPHTIPQSRAQDAEYRANYPAFEMVRAGDGKGVFSQFHSAQARLPENNYRGGPTGDGNRLRYMNPELDALMDKYAMTIPWQERMEYARGIIRLETDQVVAIGVIHSADANLIANRLDGVSQSVSNAHLWDLK